MNANISEAERCGLAFFCSVVPHRHTSHAYSFPVHPDKPSKIHHEDTLLLTVVTSVIGILPVQLSGSLQVQSITVAVVVVAVVVAVV